MTIHDSPTVIESKFLKHPKFIPNTWLIRGVQPPLMFCQGGQPPIECFELLFFSPNLGLQGQKKKNKRTFWKTRYVPQELVIPLIF